MVAVIVDKLEIAQDNRRKCSYCGETIKKGHMHTNTYVSGKFGSVAVRMCDVCIYNLYHGINRKKVKELIEQRKKEKIIKEISK